MKSPLKLALAVVACGLLASIAYIAVSFSSSDTTTLHSARVDWLPSGVTNVSHEVVSGMGAVEMIECTMTEVEFLALARQKNWEVERQEKFTASLRIQALPKLRYVDGLGEVDVILRGYRYESRRPNGGGLTVCYDLDLQRLIYQTSHR